MKKFLAMLLAVLMLVTMMPVLAMKVKKTLKL